MCSGDPEWYLRRYFFHHQKIDVDLLWIFFWCESVVKDTVFKSIIKFFNTFTVGHTNWFRRFLSICLIPEVPAPAFTPEFFTPRFEGTGSTRGIGTYICPGGAGTNIKMWCSGIITRSNFFIKFFEILNKSLIFLFWSVLDL